MHLVVTSIIAVLALSTTAAEEYTNTTAAEEYKFVILKGEDCCQIPAIMETESILCHGPYPHGAGDCWGVPSSPWFNGTCAGRGYTKLSPGAHTANATGQTDLHKCVFKGWNFSQPLDPSMAKSSWLKP